MRPPSPSAVALQINWSATRSTFCSPRSHSYAVRRPWGDTNAAPQYVTRNASIPARRAIRVPAPSRTSMASPRSSAAKKRSVAVLRMMEASLAAAPTNDATPRRSSVEPWSAVRTLRRRSKTCFPGPERPSPSGRRLSRPWRASGWRRRPSELSDGRSTSSALEAESRASRTFNPNARHAEDRCQSRSGADVTTPARSTTSSTA